MNVKKFSIIASVIFGIILITFVVLTCIPVNTAVSGVPDNFVVYKNSSVGTTYSADERPSKYNELCKLYKKMTKLSVFDYMAKGKTITGKPSQDIDNEYVTWSNTIKNDNVCLELVFDEDQNIIVSVDGNTKAIRFNHLIMVVKKSTLCREVALYFSSSSTSYQSSPILVNAKQNKLYKYIMSLND